MLFSGATAEQAKLAPRSVAITASYTSHEDRDHNSDQKKNQRRDQRDVKDKRNEYTYDGGDAPNHCNTCGCVFHLNPDYSTRSDAVVDLVSVEFASVQQAAMAATLANNPSISWRGASIVCDSLSWAAIRLLFRDVYASKRTKFLSAADSFAAQSINQFSILAHSGQNNDEPRTVTPT
jgi:hypothetical protein